MLSESLSKPYLMSPRIMRCYRTHLVCPRCGVRLKVGDVVINIMKIEGDLVINSEKRWYHEKCLRRLGS